MPSLGERIKELRNESDLTQSELASVLKITLRQLQRYEKNESDIPLSKAIVLADYFNVSLDYLIGRKSERI